MKIDISTREYLALFKAVYLADWLTNAQVADAADENREIAGIRRTVFQWAEKFGMEELAPYNPTFGECVPSSDFAGEIGAQLIEGHVDRLFWRELVARLTDKIIDEQFGSEMDTWSEDEYRSQREKIEPKVENEIFTSGMKNLFLLGDFFTDG